VAVLRPPLLGPKRTLKRQHGIDPCFGGKDSVTVSVIGMIYVATDCHAVLYAIKPTGTIRRLSVGR
jgi:hypothetical protein